METLIKMMRKNDSVAEEVRIKNQIDAAGPAGLVAGGVVLIQRADETNEKLRNLTAVVKALPEVASPSVLGLVKTLLAERDKYVKAAKESFGLAKNMFERGEGTDIPASTTLRRAAEEGWQLCDDLEHDRV